MFDQILGEFVSTTDFSDSFQFRLGCFAVVQFEDIARFEIRGDDAIGVVAQIGAEYFLGDIIVVEFVVAHGNVDIDCQVIFVFKKKAFVYINRFLIVIPQVMDRGQGELLLNIS